VADYLKGASKRLTEALARAKAPKREQLSGRYKRSADQDAYTDRASK
jgi:hypothetical protein